MTDTAVIPTRRHRSIGDPGPGAAPATRTMRAIGTTVSVAVTEPSTADDAAAMLAGHLSSLDKACSRFRPDSELRKLERLSRGRPVAVSPLLFEVLEVACAVAVKTAGTVDPTVGTAVISLGYDRDFDQIEEPGWSGRRHRPRPAPGWWRVQLDPRERTVVVPSGIRIDVGATAKAWAADRAARTIAVRLGGGILVNLGGDVAVAGTPPPGGWSVGIAEYCTTTGDAVDQVVAVHAGGLATSGTTVRSWVHNGRRVHHIIDPWSGEPAPTVWSLVSTAAASCVEANAWSTAAVVWGTDAVGALTEREIPARLVDVQGGVTRVGGWPSDRAVPSGVDGPGPGEVR